MDVGGGIGMFSLACRAVGFRRVVLVDDFADPINEEVGEEMLELHRSYGVEVEKRDVLAEGLSGLGSGFDAITFFDTIEHWHHSPKRVLHQAVKLLNPGGWIVIGVPNCVNLRKRITVPLGMGKWSQMADWYERERFRGLVREPDVDDLRYIANDLGLKSARIEGRNWAGHSSPSRVVRLATRLLDRFLRLRPSLCSDLYLMGQKA
jgi:SAM-dependent methyltransferase